MPPADRRATPASPPRAARHAPQDLSILQGQAGCSRPQAPESAPAGAGGASSPPAQASGPPTDDARARSGRSAGSHRGGQCVVSSFDSVPWDLDAEGGRAPHRPEMGRAVCGAVAEGRNAVGPDGTLVQRVKGTPQGGPISPILANLFLHYGLDAWMVREFPMVPFERFADDAVIHCVSERRRARACAGCGRASARRGRVGASSRTRRGSCIARTATAAELRAGLVYILRLHVPAPERRTTSAARGLHGLHAGGLSGQADGDEPPGRFLADSSAREPDPR